MSAKHLERIDSDIEIVTETNASAGLELLASDSFDCVVSDYNMQEMNGIEFLREVREFDPTLPFILFTGRGSEQIASEAISAGVTDYLQKETGIDQYRVLANRITNTVEQYRAVKEVEATRAFYHRILERSWDFVIIVDENGLIDYVSPAVERVMGYEPKELIGTNALDFPHPDDKETAMTALSGVLTDPDSEVTVEYRIQDADGEWRWIQVRGGNLLEDQLIEGVMVNVRDVTRRIEHEENLERQTERLQDLTRFLSHDMKNQLAIIDGHLELAKMKSDNDDLEVATRALARVEEMIDKIRQLAESGPTQLETTTVELNTMIRQSWANVGHGEATLQGSVDATIIADQDRLLQLLENLLRNAIEHGGSSVTIEIGQIEADAMAGFYVANDGPPLSVDEPDQIFESGFTTSERGTGLGLAIVKQVVDSHDWSIEVSEPEDWGVMFEITDIETV